MKSPGIVRDSGEFISDALGRPLRSLRISVTDRCNLRCHYCMPEQEYVWLPREDVLQYEEISALAGIFLDLGVDKLRLTGGEPLLRRDLHFLVGMLASQPALRDLALTTNGVMLAGSAQTLLDAGLHRVTVSLDTLRPDRFKLLTRSDAHAKVMEGIEAAVKVGFRKLKLDAVVLRGINDDEMIDLIEYGKRVGAEVRFIEYMDVGGATLWSEDKVFTRTDMLDLLTRHYGPIGRVAEENSAPAEHFSLPDGTRFGIISSTTAPFCRSCDRSRLTADGMWYLCLYARAGIDLRGPLRRGLSRDEIKRLILAGWQRRRDRGAEERLVTNHRLPLLQVDELRRDPHLEMHTRGG